VPAQRSGSVLALAALSAVATLGFARLFGDASWMLPVLLAAVGAHAVGAATRRWPGALSLAASTVALALLVCAVVAGHTTFYGLPTHATLDALGRAWAAGLDAFRNAVAPTPVTPGLLLLSVGGTWLCATAADWLAFRGEAILTALVPPFVLYVLAAALGTKGLQLPTTFAFVVAALLFVATHHAAGLPTAWFAGRTPPPGLTRLAMGAAPVALLVAAAGLVLGPSLPGARAAALLELRGSGGGGDSSRITVSPLVDLKARLTTSPPVELFLVRSPVPAYWRLTALESFDGRIWSSRGTYRPARDHLPKDAGEDSLVYRVRQEFRIGPLDSFWLPAAYRPARINLDRARVNAESLTLLTEKESAAGLIYRVESEIPRYAAADLAQSPAGTPTEMAPYLELPEDFPGDVRGLAQQVTAKASGPYQSALALQDYLRNNYTYDEAAPAGHSDDHLRYFLFRSKIGYCEQFAGAFAAMARSIGLPARVAVGFTPGAYDQALDVYHVSTKEAHAWPEIHINGVGWVAFEPTPGRFEPNPTNYTGTYNPAANAVVANTTTTTSAAEPSAPGASKQKEPDQAGKDFNNSDSNSGAGLSRWLLAAAGALPLAGALLAVPPALKRRRRARRRRAPDTRIRVAGAWSEALDRLAEVGTAPAAAHTPLEFAGRAGAARGDVGAPVIHLARLFTRASYSPSEVSEDEASQAWDEVEALTRVLDSNDSFVGRWRRRISPATLLARPGRGGAEPA
jgi:transglutaminase-like putative cysteine protease